MAQIFANIGVRRKGDPNLMNGGEALQNTQLVAIYFSAHWCPPCRNFTPVLKQFYEQVKAAGESSFEIVFVPFDRSEEDVQKYLDESHGNWLYVPFGSEHIQTLASKFSVSGIPALIVVKSDGTVVTKDGRSDVQSGSAMAAIAKWRSG